MAQHYFTTDLHPIPARFLGSNILRGQTWLLRGGARVTVAAPLGELPLFVRQGAPAEAKMLALDRC